MLASAGPGAKNEQSLSVLVKENLARAQRGEAVEVYAELVGTLERELFAQAMKLAAAINSEPRAGSVSRGLLCGTGSRSSV